MIARQLRKTFKLHEHLLCNRNIHKIKIEHIFNSRFLHQLQNQDHYNSTEIKHDKFPLTNKSKTTNIDNPQFLSCIHKPLSIIHHVTDSLNGDRKYLEKYPSVTTILSNTKPSSEFFSLMHWRKANIEKLGKEKFGLMQRQTTTKGTHFHQEMKTYFSSFNNTQLKDHKMETSGFFKSASDILANLSNPLAIESSVVHSQLGYAGTLDLVAEYMGKLSIIDWKTSQKKRSKLKDCHSYPLQLAAYAGAINYDDDYPFQISNGVLVIAYENGETADVHILSEDVLEEFWEKWLLRLNKYKTKSLEIDEPDWAIKGHFINGSDAPTNNRTNGPYLDSMDQETKWTMKGQISAAPLAPIENGTKALFSEKTRFTNNGNRLNTIAYRSVSNGSTSLNELGRRIRDEEIVATWRTLSGLIESIFGKVLLSRGLLVSHYLRSVFSELFRAIKKY